MAFRFALISALLLLSAFGAHAAQKITVIEDLPNGNVTRYDKAGNTISSALRAGETFVSVSDLLNVKNKKVGIVAVNLAYSAYMRAIITIVFEWSTGSITVVGLYSDSKKFQTLAVVGGTGAFVNAGGYVIQTDIVTPDFRRLGAKYEFYLE